jgi:site-specific recombinase XerD
MKLEEKQNQKKDYQLENPIKLKPNEATFEKVAFHAERWQRLSKSSIDHRLRCARRMSKHLVYPIKFNNPSYKQFIAYMDYRERIERASGYALMNDLRAMQMFLRAFDIDQRTWFYKLPVMPRHKKRKVPFPETVHELFNHKYSNDPYENALYQYMMFHNFFIGWRVPSEPCEMTVKDIDIDSKGRGSIIITETKKRYSKRIIIPEKYVLSAPTYKSFKNWIDNWRPKVENQYSGDALYLQPNGKPFTVRYLGKKLSENGKKVWPHYQPYVSRHWCAIALLIRTKIETKTWDTRRVQKYLGHEKPSTTDTYIEFAEEYYRQLPKDWFLHALRKHIIR